MNYYRISGIILIIMSGLIYTLERGFSLLSTSLVRAGFYSGSMTGEIPEVEASGFFENGFVPFFLVLGLAFLIYGFQKK